MYRRRDIGFKGWIGGDPRPNRAASWRKVNMLRGERQCRARGFEGPRTRV